MSRGTRDTTRSRKRTRTGLSPSLAGLSRPLLLGFVLPRCGPTTPVEHAPPVWAVPRSLAATQGITVVFFSSGYLDVSVPRVRPLQYYTTGCHVFNMTGCPIRKSADHIVCANPRSLSQLVTSFFASESLGIPHTLLLTFFTFD